jgi:predicted nucleotidyltransferase
MRNPDRKPSPLRDVVENNRVSLVSALEALGASNIRLFGSVARGDDGAESDIDLLVDLDEQVGIFALGRMRSEAERLLGHSVDIVPASGLKPDVIERVLTEAITL